MAEPTLKSLQAHFEALQKRVVKLEGRLEEVAKEPGPQGPPGPPGQDAISLGNAVVFPEA